ncbi:MFS transporter [Parasediminibacterium paludis]|uniref:MFS transporter n=1 Tax=Parasediminibacterium paludis TaxID=908966 RepID=A0ABV8PWK2_9BACT
MKKYAYLSVIIICFLMNILDGTDVMVISYAAPGISKQWLISPQSLGIVFSSALLGMALGAIFVAPRADKFGRRNIVLLCNLIMGLSVFATSWATSIEMLAIMRIVSGIGIGGMLACTATLTSESAPVKKKDFWVSFVMAGYPIGAVISGLVAAYLIPKFGWQSIFQISGAFSFLFFPIVYFLLKESNDFKLNRQPNAHFSINELLSVDHRKSTIMLWVSIFLAFATLYFLTTWIPKLASVAGLSEKLAIYAGTIFNLGAFFGIISQGYFSTKFGLQKIIAIFLFSTGLLMLMFGFFVGSDIVLVMFCFIGFGIQGGFVGIYSLAAKLYPTKIRATGIGGAVGIGRIGAIIGPMVGGALVSVGLSMKYNFILFSIPTIIGGLLVWLIESKE